MSFPIRGGEERVGDVGRLLGGTKKHHHHHGGGGLGGLLIKAAAGVAIGAVGYAAGRNAQNNQNQKRARAERQREEERQAKAESVRNSIAEGNGALQAGDYAGAIRAFEAAGDYAPNNGEVARGLKEAYRGRGEQHLEGKDYVQAIQCFVRANAENQFLQATNEYLSGLDEIVEKADTEFERQEPPSIESALKSYTEISERLTAVQNAVGKDSPLEQIVTRKEMVKSKIAQCKARILLYKADAAFIKLNGEFTDFPTRATAEQVLKRLRKVEGEHASAAGIDPDCVSEHGVALAELIKRANAIVKQKTIEELQEALLQIEEKLPEYSLSQEADLDKIMKACERWLDTCAKLSPLDRNLRAEERVKIISLKTQAEDSVLFLRRVDQTILNQAVSSAIQDEFLQERTLGEKDQERLEQEYRRVFQQPVIRNRLLCLATGVFEKFLDTFELHLRNRLSKGWFSCCTDTCNLSEKDPLDQSKVITWFAQAEQEIQAPPPYNDPPPPYQKSSFVEKGLEQPMLINGEASSSEIQTGDKLYDA